LTWRFKYCKLKEKYNGDFMKKIIIGLVLVFVLALLVSAGEKTETKEKDKVKQTAVVDTNEIRWYHYDEGLKLAKETGRPMMINFTTSWCGYCKKMNRTTFKETEVIKALNGDFVSIKVDCESNLELDVKGYKITERNLSKTEYGVRGYPTYWFLKSDASRIGPLSGYQDTYRLLDILFYIKNELSEKMKYDEYLKKGGRKGKF